MDQHQSFEVRGDKKKLPKAEHLLTVPLPKQEIFGLNGQLRPAAVGVASHPQKELAGTPNDEFR
jgi:hypothetical protein